MKQREEEKKARDKEKVKKQTEIEEVVHFAVVGCENDDT